MIAARHPAARAARLLGARIDSLQAARSAPAPRRPTARLGALGARVSASGHGSRRSLGIAHPGGARAAAARPHTRPAGQRPAARRTRTTRQAYDLLTKGFGAGTNGPLLVAVKLDPPAHSRTRRSSTSSRPEQQKQQQQATAGRYEQQPIASSVAGRPAGRAAAAGRAAGAGPSRPSSRSRPAAEEVPEVDRQRPAAGQAREPDLQDEGRHVGLAGRRSTRTAPPRSSP